MAEQIGLGCRDDDARLQALFGQIRSGGRGNPKGQDWKSTGKRVLVQCGGGHVRSRLDDGN
uniref:Uncharacterized protein n=1 Tax=Oryza sativa subsp. japonica TaxID=39947 RepID=Q5Z7I7_ORYSJ|nr:hypothetical protein [Oryza sativa Japonica Group]